MTLYQIINTLKGIALTQPNVKSATDGSVYDVMNTNPSVKYDVVHFSQTSHQSTEEWDYYGFNIFYISRLEDSLEDNRLQIQSIGKEVLDNIIRTFAENWSIPYPVSITYIPFTQKFADLTAGVYCTLRLDVPKDIICADDYLAEVVPGSGIKLQDMTVTITENGLRVFTPAAEYDGIGEIRVVTEVPQFTAELQDKEVEYTQNGSYKIYPDEDYDGMTSVTVDVDVPSRYDEGYADGKDDGKAEQKRKLTNTAFTENNTYSRVDGWSAVTVNVDTQAYYDSGVTDGKAEQKAKLSTTSFTENDTYILADGWSAVTVDVPQCTGGTYEEGYNDGKEAQKAKLASTSFTQNSAYTRADGWSAVTVDVDVQSYYDSGVTAGEEAQKAKLASTSFTQNSAYTRADGWSSVTVNVSDRYNEGYQAGYNSGVTAQKNKLVATSFTQNSAYTRTNGWSAVTVNVPSRYNEGYNAGETAQKNKLVATSFTENNTYTRADGWSAVTVDVPPVYIEHYLILNLQGDEYIIPSGTTHLRPYAFYETCFAHISIPDTVRNIGTYAFYGNECLEDITIPSSVTGIATNVFSECPNITAMTFEGLVPPTLGNSANSLGSTAYTFPIYVPCQVVTDYRTAWPAYAHRIKCGGVPLATAITLNVANQITNTGTATTTVSPSSAYTDLVYSSSDTSKAVIDSRTGVITVKANGTITITVWDVVSNLSDSKVVQVIKTNPITGITLNIDDLKFDYIDECGYLIDLPQPTIVKGAQAYATVSPTGRTTNLVYTTSDSTKATVTDYGLITALKTADSVTICVKDTISNLQDCQAIGLYKPASSITYTANTQTVPASGATRQILCDKTGVYSYGLSISGATGATFVKSGGTAFTITFPQNDIPCSKDFIATITANVADYVRNNVIHTRDITTSVTFTQAAGSSGNMPYSTNTSNIPASGGTKTISFDQSLVSSSATPEVSTTGGSMTIQKSTYQVKLIFPARQTGEQTPKNFTVKVTTTTVCGARASCTVNYTQDGY